MSREAATTIRLSDTVDQFARRVHLNVRNGKTTMVYRWKDYKSTKAHTQRMTLTDDQCARLLGALATAAGAAIGEDTERQQGFVGTLTAVGL